jgi:hypothetical protein
MAAKLAALANVLMGADITPLDVRRIDCTVGPATRERAAAAHDRQARAHAHHSPSFSSA